VKEVLATLKASAERQTWFECHQDTFEMDGNTDDAYEHGERDGRTLLARELLGALGVPFGAPEED
jgi:hypothetical protein